MPLMLNAALPVLARVTVWLTLVVPMGAAAKVRAAGVRETTPAKATPVPASATVCGLPATLSRMDTVPERVPVAVGVNFTLIVQFDPAARLAGQLLVCA